MTFRWPWLLPFLAVVPLMVLSYRVLRRRRAERRAALAAEGLVAVGPEGATIRRHVPFALFTAAVALLIVGAARPMTTVSTPRREGTVVLAIDISNSMRATDVKPTRLAAAQTAARAFVARQPTAVRIGVVAVGDGAVVVQTPTTNHADVVRSIDRLASGGGTSLGRGLITALGVIAGRPVTIDPAALANDAGTVDVGYFGSGTIVLFSDGEETSQPDPASVAEVASVAGVRIHTIGVGTEEGGVVQVDGFSIATALDRDLLEQVAMTTDGSYHEASDASGLTAISKTIDLHFKLVSQHREVSAAFSAVGLALLFVGAALSLVWFGRVM